jgi:mannitol/fructose-specific phosphotransferase system IIA component (Ntr-type)
MSERRLNVEQAAAYLNVEPQQVAKLARQGDIPFDGDREKPSFRQEELDSWASRRILGMKERRLNSYHASAERHSAEQDGEPVGICRLLSQNCILLDLPSKTKASILADVTQAADAAGLLYNPRDLLDSLRAREELSSTGIEGGVAILHPRQHDPYLAEESFLLVARTATPIHFGAPDGKPTDLFFVLVCQDDRHHLQSLTHLCLMFTQTPLLAELRAADSADGMLASLLAAERAIDSR